MTALSEILDAVWPRRCLVCGDHADDGLACGAHALPSLLPGPRCGRCALRLPDALPDGARCPACRAGGREGGPGVRRVVALFDWRAQPEVHGWILGLKYGGRADLALELGRRLARRLLEEGDGQGRVLVPVPLHPRRRMERGFDQAEHLARHAARAAGAAFRPVLRRVRLTSVQGGPGAVSRAANVRGAFAPRRFARRLPAGCSAWLVDDVVTSGATVAECARVLRRMGAEKVGVLALARAGPPVSAASTGERAALRLRSPPP